MVENKRDELRGKIAAFKRADEPPAGLARCAATEPTGVDELRARGVIEGRQKGISSSSCSSKSAPLLFGGFAFGLVLAALLPSARQRGCASSARLQCRWRRRCAQQLRTTASKPPGRLACVVADSIIRPAYASYRVRSR